MRDRFEPDRQRTVLAGSTAVFLALAFVAPAAQGQVAGQWGDAHQLYARTCAYCHDADKGGGIAPELFGRRLDPALVTYLVRRGFNAMPAFPAAQVSDRELAALARMIEESTPPLAGRRP